MTERARVRRRKIGLIFQAFHLVPMLTVTENVELPLVLDRRKDPQRVAALLERVQLLHRADHLPSELSGGERQRAAIARALVAAPALILADEPTGNLDSTTADSVLELLVEQVRISGAGMLMVTHDMAAAERGDRIIHLRDGRVLEQQVLRP